MKSRISFDAGGSLVSVGGTDKKTVKAGVGNSTGS